MVERHGDRGTFVIQLVGGPTAILEVGGLRLLTDPTFDAPGEYGSGPGRVLTKTTGPAFNADRVGRIDAILLSHDQHADNLDTSGRAFLATVPLILTTGSAAKRLGGATRQLAHWQHLDLPLPNGGTLRVTGVPAQHGPDGTDHLTGEVMGFVLSGEGLPRVYVSGDNASLDIVRRIAQQIGSVDIAVLFVGGAKSPLLGDAFLTLNSELATEATRILGACDVVPIHFEGWKHFTEGADALQRAFTEAGLIERLSLLRAGGAHHARIETTPQRGSDRTSFHIAPRTSPPRAQLGREHRMDDTKNTPFMDA